MLTLDTARFFGQTRTRFFARPRETVVASALGEVLPALGRIERALAEGRWAAGFLAYEAAGAFEPALATHAPADLPLLCFGIYDEPQAKAEPPASDGDCEIGPWQARVSEAAYKEAVGQIREHIAAGDTYQVNYTFPLYASFRGDAWTWFQRLRANQGGGYHAYLDLGRFKVLSASPELFFRLEGRELTTRPMKGTRPRGLWPERDAELAAELRASDKECAENVMIVDLLRNDMGRISETGSVEVPKLFEAERYETVWQMTSTITSRTQAGFTELLTALFPSGSVTGAPKIETMKIIRQLEPYPRGVYCGAIGWVGPDRQAEFNVPIRTVSVDTERAEAAYHIGSGVTWASSTDEEYVECLQKAALLDAERPDFELLESLLFEGKGYFLLEEHLDRLAASARYFGFSFDREAIRTALMDEAEGLLPKRHKVRLRVGREGLRVESAAAGSVQPVRVGLATEAIDTRNVFLYHKTTHRTVYEKAAASRPDCGDVLLWNERGEVTESAFANVVVERDGQRYTPPVSCGLLAGTFRRHLLESGELREAVIAKDDLRHATRLWLINSVRQWIEASLVS